MNSVRVEKNGAVTTVILDRPHARNAVDGSVALLKVCAADVADFRDEFEWLLAPNVTPSAA